MVQSGEWNDIQNRQTLVRDNRQPFPIGDLEYGQLVQNKKALITRAGFDSLPTLRQLAYQGADILTALTLDGCGFESADADQNDRVTGQTSFANTTPTFLLRVPRGTVCIPTLVALGQTGTVAGGAIDIIIEKDNVERYNTGGTSEKVFNSRTDLAEQGDATQNKCTLISTATALAGYGTRLMGKTVGADVDTAEGVDTEYLWTPAGGPDILIGPAAFLVYTYAGTTGPTWYWNIKWLEFPIARLG